MRVCCLQKRLFHGAWPGGERDLCVACVVGETATAFILVAVTETVGDGGVGGGVSVDGCVGVLQERFFHETTAW